MAKIKIVTIIGARPQFIKAGALSRNFKRDEEIDEVLVHTGQHYDDRMSKVFFEELQIPKSKYNLSLGGLSHGAMTGRMIEEIEKILNQEKPHFTLVYGDTDSTLAGALASVKLHIPIIHVEAGLRSFNMAMPEEINRILTDRISRLLFAPSSTAMQNLKNEGFLHFPCTIVQSGDIMQDAVLHYANIAQKPALELSKDFALCTIHRAENTDCASRLQEIFAALREIAKQTQIILPLHPRTQKILMQEHINTQGIMLIEPVGYLEMIWLLQHCKIVLTDSGGLQKEAYFFKKPCLTLRDETEWVELVEKGYNTIVGANRERIIQHFAKIADNTIIQFCDTLYGGGKAAETICQTIKKNLDV